MPDKVLTKKRGKTTKKLALILILALILSASSCLSTTGPRDGKKNIVVTYSVLGSVVKELVGDKANVTVSVPNGLDPHDWEPSAKDIQAINRADLVVQNGLGLEGGMGKTLEQAQTNGVKFSTATDYIIVRHVRPGEGIPSGDPDQAISAADPHFWMDPVSMKSVVIALTDELKKGFSLDVSGQATSLANRLDTLNLEVSDILSVIPAENRKLVTGHESMGYFAQRYNFKLVGVIIPSLSSQAGVSAADLAAVKKAIEDNRVKAIFTELGTSPAVAKAIGDSTGVKVVGLTTHLLPGDGSYFNFMRDVAKVIVNGLK